MASATAGQLYEILGVLANRMPAKMELLDKNRLQEEVVKQPDRFVDEFVYFLLNGARVIVSLVFQLIAVQRDMTGWKLLEPAPAEKGEFEPTIHEFLKEEDNGRCNGEEMVKRAKEQGALTGLRHAEAMLRNQERIPVEWREFVLVFAEVWLSPFGRRHVWCLYWLGERWCLNYYWLGDDFCSGCRLVASRKVSS